ncbi:tetratricopeptide repeat protein [Sinomicrobium weinanense]|uniref:Tetratricopeptide repeat protein n=1 Tax=Sinomicrobium weinanense TaxID=2842200 RepID=A0A926Q0Y2_9FLAO|nr:tetratricopeptide repeat protein [Sinomicrobium weinanense]MBC9794349.1 tetratricopeptide repeat protein [Sinomicrobium weinanense]MBU3124256.1 tetratricopeptide repeat protein [Sinomicrobium weinanense]
MKQFFINIILIFLLGFSGFSQGNTEVSSEKLFEEATSLYNDGKYEEAAENYRAILDQGEHSSAVYYNLGNSYYKLKRIPESIYYYEKALQLSPNDKDIRNNLAFARNMTIDAIEQVPQTGMSKFWENFAGNFHYNTWAGIAVFFAFLSALLFLFYYYLSSSVKKRIFFASSILSVICLLFCVYVAYDRYQESVNTNFAIIFAEEARVKSEPNSRSEEAFLLHSGTKVQVLETLDDWKHIKLADGKTGWLRQGDMKAL